MAKNASEYGDKNIYIKINKLNFKLEKSNKCHAADIHVHFKSISFVIFSNVLQHKRACHIKFELKKKTDVQMDTKQRVDKGEGERCKRVC